MPNITTGVRKWRTHCPPHPRRISHSVASTPLIRAHAFVELCLPNLEIIQSPLENHVKPTNRCTVSMLRAMVQCYVLPLRNMRIMIKTIVPLCSALLLELSEFRYICTLPVAEFPPTAHIIHTPFLETTSASRNPHLASILTPRDLLHIFVLTDYAYLTTVKFR